MGDRRIQDVCDALRTVHRRFTVRAGQDGITLLDYLKRTLPHIEVRSWPERFAWGGIFVNGRPAVPALVLQAPCVVEYFEPKLSFAELAAMYPAFDPARHILFEDRDVLIAFKPAGLPTKPAKEQQKFSLMLSLEQYAGRKIHMPSRLDAATAGVVIASKSRRAHAALQICFEQHKIAKQYLLEVAGAVPWQTHEVDAPIDRDPRHPVLRKIGPGGKPALTRFRRLTRAAADGRDGALLLAQPVTGRTHQIRVHIASLGLPIIGDAFYGGRPADDLHLLSYRIRLQHPFAGEKLDVCVPAGLLPEWAKDSGAERL